MSSILSAKLYRFLLAAWFGMLLSSCSEVILNDPYSGSQTNANILYASFAERPKHLDPAKAYSSNEYALIGQIYEPPLQYHYLLRPYQLVPLTAEQMPKIIYRRRDGSEIKESELLTEEVASTDYVITIQPGIRFQPHPAFAKDTQGDYRYHALQPQQLQAIKTLSDFAYIGTRELQAADYVQQIKRLVHEKIHSPIAGIMRQHIVGLDEFAKKIKGLPLTQMREQQIAGVTVLNKYQYRIRINGKYPQFRFWLAMPFFAPMPWEADVFYDQQGLKDKNITLDWYPVGTGPYLLQENNPNRRMILVKNPNFHLERYPDQGEQQDRHNGLLQDAGKPLPFIDKVVYMLEKETIPYWNKFLQGYYDASGIASDSFDQAVKFSANNDFELTPEMLSKDIKLQTTVTSSIFYMGFNMLDTIVGGDSERARLLRQAISIAIDYEEYISIFMNGRGIAAQGLLPPGIYGYVDGAAGINPYVYDWVNAEAQRKPLKYAQQLLHEAGYPQGLDSETGEALILYLDTPASSPDDRARLNWYRKQFEKLGIKLVIRATDYNRFQQKMRNGNAQIFMWGWNADYPDPENFFFLLYGPNAKVAHGGENAVNFSHVEFDRLFERMRDMPNGLERMQLIQQLQEIVRNQAPWIFGLHPKSFSLYHGWYGNLKPNLMANNRLKYLTIDVAQRAEKRRLWNRPVLWPLILLLGGLMILAYPAIQSYRSRRLEQAL